MSTPIGTTEYTETPKDLTPEYEVERDGRVLLCQMIAYRGHIYEVCRADSSLADYFKQLVPEPFVKAGDIGHEQLANYLEDSAHCEQQQSAE